MKKLKSGLLTLFQVVLLSVIWFFSDWLVQRFHIPLPSNLLGMLLLLALIFCRVINENWLRRGATWLLAEMLLFFVPAVIAIVNYKSMVEHEGLQIIVVLVVSTIMVIAFTSLVVDRVYRLELKLQRRKHHRQHQLIREGH